MISRNRADSQTIPCRFSVNITHTLSLTGGLSRGCSLVRDAKPADARVDQITHESAVSGVVDPPTVLWLDVTAGTRAKTFADDEAMTDTRLSRQNKTASAISSGQAPAQLQPPLHLSTKTGTRAFDAEKTQPDRGTPRYWSPGRIRARGSRFPVPPKWIKTRGRGRSSESMEMRGQSSGKDRQKTYANNKIYTIASYRARL